jgi:hypothetical protein
MRSDRYSQKYKKITAITRVVTEYSLKKMAVANKIKPTPKVDAFEVTEILRYTSGFLSIAKEVENMNNTPMVDEIMIKISLIFFLFFPNKRHKQ